MTGLLCLAGLVLGIIAVRRTRARGPFAERIARLEREVRELRAKMEPVAPAVPPPADVRVAAEPPRRPPLRPPGPPPPPPPRVEIDWEQLFGVRAAAVLGGVALALAGLLFFKYSVEHGLIPPWLRVVLGTLVGLTCVAGSEWTLRRRYAGTANALAGAGVVVLYAAFWAASVRYGLIGLRPGLVLMIAVTTTCCLLSARHRSQVIALIGLAGGFATPMLLSSGSDRPLGLFGYVLLLDVGLLYVARRRQWSFLGPLSLAGTVLYEALWIGARMGPDRLFLGLVILAVFAVLFAVATPRGRREDGEQWLTTQAAGVLLPFAFVLYLAARAPLAPHLHPLALLVVLLSAAAGWIAREQRTQWLGLGAASGSVAVVAAWLFGRSLTVPLAWEAALWCAILPLVFHLFVEWEPARTDVDGPASAAVVASAGFLALLVIASTRAGGTEPWPWLVGFLGPTALLVRHAGFPGREFLHVPSAITLGIGLVVLERVHGAEIGFPPHAVYFGVLLAAAVALQVVASARRGAEARRWAEHGAGALAVVLLLHLAIVRDAHAAEPYLVLGTTLALGLLVALAGTRLPAGPWLLVAVLGTALAHTQWTAALQPHAAPRLVLTGLGIQMAAVLLFTGWPFVVAARLRSEPLAWTAAALAGPAWFLSLKRLFELRFGGGLIGFLPVTLAVVSLVAAARARDLWPADEPRRTSCLAWFSAVALAFATVAVPLQLEKEWITIGWALEGIAVIALWTRLDHPGLKWFGLGLLAAVTVRLVANDAVLGYYPRPATRIVNWLLYTYLVPAGALLGAAALLRPRELARLREWERGLLYARQQPVGAFGAGLAGLLVIFVWINLAIIDWFATGPVLRVSFERLPARDLAMSLAWALYALALLAAGMRRRSIGLRWVSLGLLMVTIAKVFLHDLGELRDLYRVASLLGLALSLIVVSLAYQRFVFRNAPAEET